MPADRAFVLRRATGHDAPALGRLGALLMRAHYSFDPQRFLRPGSDPGTGYGAFLRAQLQDDNVVVLVAERDGAVIGYVYAGIEPLSWKELRDECGFIHDVAIEEGARNLGVATALVEAAVDWLRARGAPRVMLWAAEQNAPAQRLFDRLGFRRTMVEMTREVS